MTRRWYSTHRAHAKAPLAVYTLLAGPGSGEDLGNGWERCHLPDDGVGLFDRENNEVRLLQPPDLTYTRSVVALDGIPTKRLWELTLGTRLKHRQLLTDEERQEHIRDVLGLKIVPTSEHMKPYSGNADYVNLDEDRALLEEIRRKHGRKPVLISTNKAIKRVYEPEGVFDGVSDHEHYGNLKSSNQFETERVGAITGSRHYGDRFIQKWGAYEGEVVERNGEKGVDLSYGTVGDEIYQHMTHHETLQAVMRFGRDGNGATVYVHTAALPDWVPTAGVGRVLPAWSEGMREVMEAANGLSSWRTRDIAEHPGVSISERQVREHLNTLVERGHVERETEGRGHVWRDDGLHKVNDHGEVDLDVVEDEETVTEVARSSIYTWEFRKTGGSHDEFPGPGGQQRKTPIADGGATPIEDDPPPS